MVKFYTSTNYKFYPCFPIIPALITIWPVCWVLRFSQMKQAPRIASKCLILLLVAGAGFEPTTFGL